MAAGYQKSFGRAIKILIFNKKDLSSYIDNCFEGLMKAE